MQSVKRLSCNNVNECCCVCHYVFIGHKSRQDITTNSVNWLLIRNLRQNTDCSENYFSDGLNFF